MWTSDCAGQPPRPCVPQVPGAGAALRVSPSRTELEVLWASRPRHRPPPPLAQSKPPTQCGPPFSLLPNLDRPPWCWNLTLGPPWPLGSGCPGRSVSPLPRVSREISTRHSGERCPHLAPRSPCAAWVPLLPRPLPHHRCPHGRGPRSRGAVSCPGAEQSRTLGRGGNTKPECTPHTDWASPKRGLRSEDGPAPQGRLVGESQHRPRSAGRRADTGPPRTLPASTQQSPGKPWCRSPGPLPSLSTHTHNHPTCQPGRVKGQVARRLHRQLGPHSLAPAQHPPASHCLSDLGKGLTWRATLSGARSASQNHCLLGANWTACGGSTELCEQVPGTWGRAEPQACLFQSGTQRGRRHREAERGSWGSSSTQPSPTENEAQARRPPAPPPLTGRAHWTHLKEECSAWTCRELGGPGPAAPLRMSLPVLAS